jgi:twitching motility protein PilI
VVNKSKKLMRLLQDMEIRSQEHTSGLPQEDELVETWEGVLISVAGENIATPLHEVKEILNFPAVNTPVPGAKPWVRGVANVRGNLLPIIDLQLFLGGEPIVAGQRTKVLVIDYEGLFAGLMVADVLGMKHFPRDLYINSASLVGPIGKYLQGGFKLEDEVWPLFSMYALVEDPSFQVAAA